MKISAMPFSSFKKAIMSCLLSCSDRLSASRQHNNEGNIGNLEDLYSTMGEARDQEMERLVRAIEKTRDDSLRYQ